MRAVQSCAVPPEWLGPCGAHCVSHGPTRVYGCGRPLPDSRGLSAAEAAPQKLEEQAESS